MGRKMMWLSSNRAMESQEAAVQVNKGKTGVRSTRGGGALTSQQLNLTSTPPHLLPMFVVGQTKDNKVLELVAVTNNSLEMENGKVSGNSLKTEDHSGQEGHLGRINYHQLGPIGEIMDLAPIKNDPISMVGDLH